MQKKNFFKNYGDLQKTKRVIPRANASFCDFCGILQKKKGHLADKYSEVSHESPNNFSGKRLWHRNCSYLRFLAENKNAILRK